MGWIFLPRATGHLVIRKAKAKDASDSFTKPAFERCGGDVSMTEIKDCLPEDARKHFINLRNIRLGAEKARYRQRLSELRAQLAAKGQGRSGWQEMEEWKYKEELSDALATGYIQDAIETCHLYEIPLTEPLCECLAKATEEMLSAQYHNALQAQAQGVSDVKVPLSVRQQGNMRARKIMPQIRVMIERARVEHLKKKATMEKQKEKYGDTYTQSIIQHGGVMNASQTGNVSAQQLTVGELENLRPALAEMRAFFKKQNESVETDEFVGLLASAEKAAAEKDEHKMLGYLQQIPSKAWEIGKVIAPQVLLHYLKQHGLA